MMEEEKKLESQPSPETTEPLGGWNLKLYFKLLKWPIIVVLVINIFLIISEQKAIYTWFLDLLLFVFLGFLAVKKNKANQLQAIILGIFGGLLVGIGVALIKLIKKREFYAIFYFVTDPLLTAAMGLVICSLVYFIVAKDYRSQTAFFKPEFFKKNQRKEVKNGREKNGRR